MRFTIRDLLWLTLVAALAAAWWTENMRSASRYVDSQKTLVRQARLQKELDAESQRVERLAKAMNFYERIRAGDTPFTRPKTGPIGPANGYPNR